MSAYQGDVGAAAGAPSEEQLQAYEEELARISVTDMIAQITVSLLNLGARKLAPPGGGGGGAQGAAAGADSAGAPAREQVRDAIDAARALLDILERTIPDELAPLRDALSRLQMAYAREARSAAESDTQPAGGGEEGGGKGGAGAGGKATESEQQGRRPGPAEASGRLWVPGS